MRFSGIANLREFNAHRAVEFVHDPKTGMRAFIAIHRRNGTYPSFGATRVWHYATDWEALDDALRLSRLMSYKSALAGLKCGGAKGVIIKNSFKESDRQRALKAYAKEVTKLAGSFVTGADAGIAPKDLLTMRATPYSVGYHVDPTEYTALGVFESIKAALSHVFGNRSIAGRTFAIQGIGKIGRSILQKLYDSGGNITTADINPTVTKLIKQRYPKVRVVSKEALQTLPVDVYVPCALSHAINERVVKNIACRMIVGGANNQLSSEAVGRHLHARGILYAPDYVVNAGGLISVVDEYEHPGKPNPERISLRVSRIPATLSTIFQKAKRGNLPPFMIADQMAEEIISRYE